MRKKKESPLNEYGKLSGPLKSIVKILAVQVLEFRQMDLVACLKELKIKDEDNKAFTAISIAPVVKKLAGLKLITKKNTGVACAGAIRIPVVKDVVTGCEFEAMATAVLSIRSFEDGLSGYGGDSEREFYRAFQFAVFNNQAQADLEMALGIGWQFSSEFMLGSSPLLAYFNQPFSSELLKATDNNTKAKILVFTLIDADRGLYPAHEFFKYCNQFFLEQPGFIQEKVRVMEYLLIRGELEAHGRLLDQIEDEAPIDYAAHMGWRLMLCNETNAALTCFNKSLALIKKETRKRKIFLDGLPGLFFLFALLKTKDDANLKVALTHIDSALKKKTLHSALFRGMVPVFQDGLGQACDPQEIELLAEEEFSHFSILSFFKILILTWMDKDQGKEWADDLNLIRYKAKLSGHQWLEAESRYLLLELGIRKQNKDRAEKLHSQCGTVSLIPIVTQVPRWEKALNALINIGKASSDEVDQLRQTPSQRIIWLIDYDEKSGTCDILPRLQKFTKKKAWTKGRAVAMKNLYKNYRTMEGLTEQDKSICSTIEENTYRDAYYGYGYGYSQTEYEFDKKAALPSLVGHPLIFLEGDLKSPIELTASEPEVRLRKGKNGIRLKMVPMPGPNGSESILIRESPSRFKLVSFTEKHETIAALLGKKGLKLPGEAQQDATKAMASLSSLVQVNSDLALDTGKDALQVEADPTPHVHIMPWQEGISIEFWVRPFRYGGSYLKPGRGGSHVFSRVDGENRRAERDLGLEKTLSDDVITISPTLDYIEPADGQWRIDDPEQSLELLLELRSAGDKAILEWPKGEQFKVKQEVVSDHFSLGIKKDREWFKATGSLVLDEENSLDLKTLLAKLENATGRFLPLGDGEFLALTRSLKERLEELKSYSSPHGKGVRFAPLASPAIEEFTQSIGTLKTDKAWKAHCKKFKESIEPQIPGTLQAELRDYQKTGFNWLAQLSHWQVGACLADDMGLGKTLQALAVLLLGADKGPSLVVAPLSVAANWQEECLRFAPTLVPKVFGPGDRQTFLSDLSAFDLVITSYGLLQIEAEKLAGVNWHTVVLDEAQAIKNMKSKRSKAAMGLSADFRLITTGTPVENHLDELWTLFNFLNPGLLGPFSRFREKFALPIERDGDKTASRRLRKLISPFILRRLKVDVLKELPEKTQVTLHVEMSQEESMVYEAHRLKALEKIESSDTGHPGGKHLKILAELTRLRQLCCNPSLVMPDSNIKSSKLKVFSDTVDELLENRHKALVFSQFVGHLKILREFLDSRGISYQYLDGSTSAKKRQLRINAFQGGQGDLFLISLKAGGSGLNLTAADYVIHMDPWWNPAVEDQASDRVHRIGQVRPVTVYRLVVKDTIEERIMALHEEKRDLARNLLTGSDIAGKISADELLELLRG